jgi:cyanophycin synthetase
VAGTNGKTTTVRLIAHLLASRPARGHDQHRRRTSTAAHRHRRLQRPAQRPQRAAAPDVDAAVLETARGGVLREGLGFDRCDVAVVTNIGMGDHLGLSYISTVEDLAVVKRVIVQNVAPTGTAVLNAADPMVAKMAAPARAR